MIIGRESKKQFTLRIALHMKKPHNFCCDTCKRIFLLIKKTISANFLYLRKSGSQHELHSSLQSNPTMEKGEPSNVSYEEFEPFCKWKKLEDSDVLEVHLPDFKKEELRVRIKNNSILTVSGEHPTAKDGKKMHFNREIKLPKDIYPDQIRAKFGGSILSITMPKKASSPEIAKPSPDAASDGKLTASNNDNGKPKNFISRLTSPLSRLKFSKETATAMAAAVVILAFGVYYLIKN